MARRQAQAGGQYGKNGEWYDGGQFLPSSETTVKGEVKVAKKKAWKPRKVEVAPFTWVFPEAENMRPLYFWAGTAVTPVRDNGWIDRDNPKLETCEYTSYYKNDPAYFDTLVEMFNNGIRWEITEEDGTVWYK